MIGCKSILKGGETVFRYKKAVPVGYVQQGYIYFCSKMYKWLPVEKRRHIEQLCETAGGGHAPALLEFMTTDSGAAAVCKKHYLSASTLERAVKRYYVLFAKELKG